MENKKGVCYAQNTGGYEGALLERQPQDGSAARTRGTEGWAGNIHWTRGRRGEDRIGMWQKRDDAGEC